MLEVAPSVATSGSVRAKRQLPGPLIERPRWSALSGSALAGWHTGCAWLTFTRGAALAIGPTSAGDLARAGVDGRCGRIQIEAFRGRVHLLLHGVVIGREPLYPTKAVNN